jgi:hypothetical protein
MIDFIHMLAFLSVPENIAVIGLPASVRALVCYYIRARALFGV